MNFSFYIFGSPNGYNQYPADNNNVVFQEFAQSNTTESQLTIKRSGQLVYYAYIRRLQEKSSNFLGFCLVFNGVYCRNLKKLFELFDRAFFDAQLKGEFLKFDKGKANYVISKFAERSLEIERIKTFFKNNLENDFPRDFTNLSPAFKFGNGNKTISIKENDIDILATVAEYEVVHISNNEKSLSELERTQKMLTDLYAEKYTFQQNYNKLLAKKKQYSVVIILCFILIGCGIGLFVFNKSLHNKDNQIANLNKEITQQNNDIDKLNNNVFQLQIEQQKLTNEKSRLQNNISELITKNNELTTTIDQLNSDIYNKDSRINNLESSNNQYRTENSTLQSKNRSLQNDVDRYKKYEPITYKAVYKANYYFKYKCNDSYKETNCYTGSGGTTVVYTTSNGYGLTEYGWVKMSDLSKY